MFKLGLRSTFNEYRYIYGADAFFISFPKCGRTWVRSMLGKSFHLQFGLPEATDLLEVDHLHKLHKGIPKILFEHDDEPFWKTPAELSPSKTKYKFQRVIFLVRHPADVLVSSYFEKTKRYVVHGSKKPGFEGSLREYIHSPQGSTDTLIRYYNIWAKEGRKLNRFMMLRYEDLLGQTEPEFVKMIRFLKLENVIDKKHIGQAIAYSSFQNMQTREQANAYRSFRLTPGDVNDLESYKTRRGKAGGYLDYLDPPEIAFLAQKVNGELDGIFGYSM